ncbi:MAG: hypothetical protein AAFX41_18290, partial [Bacteroidota bacterium]
MAFQNQGASSMGSTSRPHGRGRALCTGLTILCSTLALAEDRTPFTLEDLFDIRSVGTVTVSPDGSHTLYTRWRRPNIIRGEADGYSVAEVRLWRAAGPDPRVFDEAVGAYGFDWIDDKQLTFQSGRLADGGVTIFTVDFAQGGFDQVIKA